VAALIYVVLWRGIFNPVRLPVNKGLKICFAVVMLVGSSQVLTAQNTLPLAVRIESGVREREPDWKMLELTGRKRGTEKGFISFTWGYGEQRVAVKVSEYGSAEKAAEDLRDRLFKVDATRVRIIELPNLGDEAYFFISEGASPNHFVIVFRQGKIITHIVGSEDVARKFAGHVSDSISAT
jgi:hypothetical protein